MSRFEELVDELKELHAKKGADYGSNEDPLANIRAAEDFGLSPLMGVFLRMGDKMHRIQTFAKKGNLANEGLEDSLRDMAVYSVIGLVLLGEEEGPRPLPFPFVHDSACACQALFGPGRCSQCELYGCHE